MSEDDERLGRHHEANPPDPTALTTAQLLRELSSLRSYVDVQRVALGDRISTRLDAMDKAMDLFTTNLTRVPTEVDKAVAGLRMLHDEKFKSTEVHLGDKFASLEMQLRERDARFLIGNDDSKVAIAAALQAARELSEQQNRSNTLAISKSETGTEKAIYQLQTLIQTALGAIDSRISDIKDRLTIIEAKRIGQETEHLDRRGATTQWMGVLGAIIGVAGLAVAIILALTRPSPETSRAPIVIERPATPNQPPVVINPN